MKTLKLIFMAGVMATSTSVYAAAVDGVISDGEYSYSTLTANALWGTDGTSPDETSDGSYNHKWDIDFLGLDFSNGNLNVGVAGGQVLSGQEVGNNIYIGDLALGFITDTNVFDATSAFDPGGTFNFQYGISLYSVGGSLEMELYEVDSWEGADLYGGAYASNTASDPHDHITNTYKIDQGTKIDGALNEKTAVATSTSQAGDDYVLEASYDLGLLSLFDENQGGEVIAYLTMACVNDEAMVKASIPSAVPVPGAAWLFGSALIGFIGLSRRTKLQS